MKSILLIRLSALGDVLLATPTLQALRDAWPEARIDWLTSASYAPLLQGLPGMGEVLITDRTSWRATAREVRARRYDLVVDLQHKLRTSFIAARSGAPRRVALHRRTWGGVLRAGAGFDRPVRGAHQTARDLVPLRALGLDPAAPSPLRIGLLAPVERAAREAVAALLGTGQRPLVALAPGAAHATKRWPAERFAEAARSFPGHRVVLIGARSDAAALDAVRATLPADSVDARELDLASTAVLLQGCALLLSNDSGPVHLAQAVGTPVVALFGPTDARRWGPRGELAAIATLDLPCSPCSNHGGPVCPIGTHACLRDLAPAHVVQLGRALLRPAPP